MKCNQQQPFSVGGKSFTAVAITTAAKAGEWIMTKLGNYSVLDTKSSSSDLVTEVDQGAEKLIRNLIQTYFPHHSFLGEEGVEPGSEASVKALESMGDEEYLWIVDPIDGTTNFVHGFPYFCVSIALAHKGELILGVIYDPTRDELFVAEKGKGAYVKGMKMRTAPQTELRDSLLAGGFPADEDARMLNLKGMQAIVPKVRNVRTTGAAALHLAYVAAGRVTGFWEVGLSVWDIAAGALLVQEAGGTVTNTQGNPFTLATRNIVATNGHIHDELIQELTDADSTGF